MLRKRHAASKKAAVLNTEVLSLTRRENRTQAYRLRNGRTHNRSRAGYQHYKIGKLLTEMLKQSLVVCNTVRFVDLRFELRNVALILFVG